MRDRTKNETVIAALHAGDFRDITLSVVPKRFLCHDGHTKTELEFSRTYFETTPPATLQTVLWEQVVPAMKQHPGKRIYVAEHGISVSPRTPHTGEITFPQKP